MTAPGAAPDSPQTPNLTPAPTLVQGRFRMRIRGKNLLPSELERIRQVLEPDERKAARERMARGRKGANNSQPRRAIDAVGERLDVTGRHLEKIRDICAAAEADPERYGHLVAEMDRTRKVNGAYTKLLRLRDQARVLPLVPAPGKFRALVVDPPWDFSWLSDSLGPAYATMTPEQILALPVAGWAAESCHLYLWTPNNFMPVAVAAMAAWGFQHKTVLTWDKISFGQGVYFRNASEHVLFGTRGDLGTRSRSISTVFRAPRGAHSEKPEPFYEIVRASSYPPFGEAFQRQARPDFANLYQPAESPAERVEAAE